MKRYLLPCVALALVACKPTQNSAAVSNAPLRTDTDRTLYALGLMMGQRLDDFNLTPAELAIVEHGMRDKITHAHPVVELSEWGPHISTMARERQQARAGIEHTRGAAFVETASHEAGAQRLPSGVIYRETRAGTGPQPTATDRVRVNYRGTLIDGTEFDSSYTRHQPAEFALNGVIPCWTQGVAQMHVGGEARLVCPADQAYGDRGQRNIPPGSTLIFQVELLEILAAHDGGAPGVVMPTSLGGSVMPGGSVPIQIPTGTPGALPRTATPLPMPAVAPH